MVLLSHCDHRVNLKNLQQSLLIKLVVSEKYKARENKG